MFTAMLCGLARPVSSGEDHTWGVVGPNFFRNDLTHAQAEALAARLNTFVSAPIEVPSWHRWAR